VINIFFAIAVLLVLSAESCMADTVVQAEIPTAVKLSNRDINRIVCPGQMNDLIFSQVTTWQFCLHRHFGDSSRKMVLCQPTWNGTHGPF